MKITGAWLTDIDDTLVKSGEMPSASFINWLTEKIKTLKKHNIYWVPMSGVAMVKLGPRILYRLPEDVLSNVIYYAGDGSQKYRFNTETGDWEEDIEFRRTFSDAQTISVLGKHEFRKTLKEANEPNPEIRIQKAIKELEKKGLPKKGILEELKRVLQENGFPDNSETYFRGGSVSWMMLGDISAEPYRQPKAAKLREQLIDLAKQLLKERENLRAIGEAGITVPFPGARGIKFVLEGNTKERAARDLIEKHGIQPKHMLFAGNELFEGGNDNMMRNLKGITLLSVGEYEDPGERVIAGRISIPTTSDSFSPNSTTVTDVLANKLWMDWTTSRLELGYGWEGTLHIIQLFGSRIFGMNEKIAVQPNGNINLTRIPRKKRPEHKDINTIFFDKGGTLSFRVQFDDGGIKDIKKIMEIVGANGSPQEFAKMLEKREKEYKNWSLETEIEADEEEIWTRWLLPDFPKDIVVEHAVELNLLLSHSKGHRQFRDEAHGIIKELYLRGYKIGIISNTVSRVLVPGEIEEAGIAQYIDVLIMSSLTNRRKPDSKMFLMAAEKIKSQPEQSAYIGDKPNRDVEGPKRAGFRLSIVLHNDTTKDIKKLKPIQRPDIIINSFEELLEIFP